MKIKLLLVLLLAIPAFVLAQGSEKFTITGKVVDKQGGVPLEYATITVTDATNSQAVEGGITDPNGSFSIDVPSGNYNIKIEYISFAPYQVNNRAISKNTDLGTITLEFAASDLDEVTVIAETTTVDVRLDKKIYNIGKDLTTAGGTVSDALNNVPSVSVDVEGGISLRGNENVRVLINGKPSAMAGFGSTDVLRQLPADAIERVEVITSPSARYDAEGTAGIINIILRKEKTLGFNGSLNLNAGNPDNFGASANLNYRTEKYNLFNTTGFRYANSPGNAYFDTRYNSTSSSDFDRIIEDRIINRLDRGFNTNLGMEYYLSDNSSVTGTLFYRNGNDQDNTINHTRNFNDNNLSLGTTRIEDQAQDDESFQVSLNYMKKFNDKGHQLTADFQYDIDNELENSLINENVTFSDSNESGNFIDENITTKEDQKEYLFQTDYVLPFGEDSQFEAGYRGNFENTVTDYTLQQEDSTGSQSFVVNDTLTNSFDYTENVNALYTQYGTKLGDFSFLLGLRLENTQLKGKIDSRLTEVELQDIFGFAIDTDFDNNYLGLFPTLNLIYELGEMENITVGYNRRINRPRGWFINPFPSRSSRNNVFQGNPNLSPAYSNAYDVGYLKKWEKLTFTSSVYFQHETDAFERVEENIANSSVIRTIPINLSSNDRTGAEIGLLYNPIKWARLNGSFNFFQFKTEGEFNGVDYGAKNTSWFARFSSKITLPAKIDWQTNAFYRGPSQGAQTKTDGLLSIDLAFSKDIFKESATVSLNVQDLLNSRKRNSFTTNPSFTQDSEFQWRERQINVSLMYRFNQQKNQQNKQNRESNDDQGEDFGGK
ncbi:MAG: TonB-dependent receptor [Leeuwenhoekiella sp.]